MLALLLAGTAAMAGYGDPADGVPSPIEREVHFWSNAIRTDPAHFSEDYPCSFSSFSSSEKTPKSLLWWDQGLGDAARYHSADMDDQGYFDHDSIDGTSWSTRIYRFYDGITIGENIAAGYWDAGSAVFDGWMCSSGHRANIMSGQFNELGTGVSGSYYTQDFGLGDDPGRAMAMGVHLPEVPQQTPTVDLAVVLEGPSAPDAVYAVYDGVRVDLDVVIGEADLGVYAAEVANAQGCHEYYFVMEVETGADTTYVETFPEDGSYGWGGCAFDDPEAGWLAGQLPLPADPATDPGTGDPGDPGGTGTGTTPGGGDPATADGLPTEPSKGEAGGCGCAATGYGTGAGWLVVPLALLAVRRRRGQSA